MIRNLLRIFNRKQVEPISDLNRGVDTIIEAVQFIVPEKRFDALKVVVETMFENYHLHQNPTRKKVA